MRKRSRYRPMTELPNPLTRLEPLNREQQQALLLRCYSALNSMTKGAKAEPNDWRDIADVLNIVETMTLHTGHLTPGPIVPALEQVRDAMKSAQARHQRGLGLRLDGMGLGAVRFVLDIYAEAISVITAADMLSIIKKTHRLVAAAQAAGDAQVVSL